MLIDRNNFHYHRPWIVATLIVALLAVVWFVAATRWDQAPPWPAGSSGPGLVFGIVGGLICLFEFVLYFRKKFRSWRFGRVQVWMRAHIWLGLLSVPLLILHSGLRFHNQLALVTLVLFLVVIASGIWGLVLQQFLPTRMLNEVPAETIASQIPAVSTQLAREAERIVRGTCGVPSDPAANVEGAPDFIVVGRVRSQGELRGKVLETMAPAPPVPQSEFLLETFEAVIRPYLERGRAAASPLANGPRAAAVFAEVRLRVHPEAHGAVAAVEQLVQQRRELDRQEQLDFWLQNWLWVHLPLSVALMVLMAAHTVVALRYMYTG